jgi:hypothetical protein
MKTSSLRLILNFLFRPGSDMKRSSEATKLTTYSIFCCGFRFCISTGTHYEIIKHIEELLQESTKSTSQIASKDVHEETISPSVHVKEQPREHDTTKKLNF